MWHLIIYGVYRLQEVRKRPVRLTELLDVRSLLQRFGVTLYDSEEEYVRALEGLTERGYLEKSGGGYAVTEMGRQAALKCSSSYVKMLKEYIDKAVEAYTYIPQCVNN